MTTYQYWLMDERGLDPDQFADATVYAVADTIEEARTDQQEAGCGVLIKVELRGDEAAWVEAVDDRP